VPYLLAGGFVHGGVGLAHLPNCDRYPKVLALAAKGEFS